LKSTLAVEIRSEPREEEGRGLGWGGNGLRFAWPRYPYIYRRPNVTLDPKTKYRFTFERVNLSRSDSGAELLKIEKDGETIFDGWMCEVHRVKMDLKDVPVIYGFVYVGRPHILSDEQWLRIQMAKFPHHDERIFGGCIVGASKSAPKLVCAKCKKAYDDWAKLDERSADAQIPPLDVKLPYPK
jgi:hypothetical protein